MRSSPSSITSPSEKQYWKIFYLGCAVVEPGRNVGSTSPVLVSRMHKEPVEALDCGVAVDIRKNLFLVVLEVLLAGNEVAKVITEDVMAMSCG